jgi:hypothetical protein
MDSAPALLPVTGRAAMAAPADLPAAAPSKWVITMAATPTMSVPPTMSALYFNHIDVDRGIPQQRVSRRHG